MEMDSMAGSCLAGSWSNLCRWHNPNQYSMHYESDYNLNCMAMYCLVLAVADNHKAIDTTLDHYACTRIPALSMVPAE